MARPEDIEVSEPIKIQIKINDKVAEEEDKKTAVLEKGVEIQKLRAEQARAYAKDYRAKVEEKKALIAKGNNGIITARGTLPTG